MYVNNKSGVAIAVVYDDKCYSKGFDDESVSSSNFNGALMGTGINNVVLPNSTVIYSKCVSTRDIITTNSKYAKCTCAM